MRGIIRSCALLIFGISFHFSAAATPESDIDILRYRFSIGLSDTADLVTGKAIILFKIDNRVSSLVLDLRNVNDKGFGMYVSDVSSDSYVPAWSHQDDHLTVRLPDGAKTGDTLSVTVEYHGIPSDGLVISETKFGHRSFFADHWPDRARNYLPCVDHVADKAAVEFIVTAPAKYTVVSNGARIKEAPAEDGYKTTHWIEDTPIPVKVMTFGVCEFAVEMAGSVDGTEVWTYVYPENSKEGFYDYSVALIPLNFYSSLIGPYPFPKLANVQSKTMFGGLENAGCIFYSENSVSGTGRSEGLIAHEIAHQWFGNSVTEGNWHHIWLSEGFATYLTSMYWEMRLGEERLKSDMISARNRVLRASRSNPSAVIDTTIVNLMQLLSANSYQKGAWVLHMLRNKIGDNAFQEGLRLYYSRFKNGNALTADFREVMEEVSETDLESYFHQWLYVPGNPEVKVKWEYNPGSSTAKIVVSQLQDYVYQFPLELELLSGDKRLPLSYDISARESVFTIDMGTSPDTIIIDPHIRLLAGFVTE